MFEALRDRIAARLEILALRLTSDPRYPDSRRIFSSIKTLAGVVITPDTAVTIAAVWACLRYLSQTVAVLPWHVMMDGAKGAEIQSSNRIDYLLWKRASPECSSFQFRETLTHWALRYGNGYAEIEPDTAGRPFAMHPIHPERVKVCREIEGSESDYGDTIAPGELYYEVSNGTDSTRAIIAAKRMFHIRGFGEGPVGVNVIEYASQSLGWAHAAQLFGAAFFGNGLNPSGLVVNKHALSKPARDLQRKELNELYGGPKKAHKFAILDKDVEFKPITFNARESQLIDVHQHLVEEVCRWFGVPPHKIMHLLRSTFSNIEHQAIEVVQDSITPWVKRFEDEADHKLFGQNRQGLYTKINMNGMLRGDSIGRAQFYRAMFDMGVFSPNRILELEDENTIGEDGDKHLVQLNLTTLEKAGEQPEPAPAPAPTEPEEPESDEEAVAALERTILAARECANV